MSDFDAAWKETMDSFLPAFLRFFFPDVFADIDWTRDVQSMEQEFRTSMQPGLGNKVICDKLILCRSRSRSDPLLLHFEVNCYRDEEYPVRLLRYNTRGWEKYGTFVATFSILGDDDPTWFPATFLYAYAGYRKEETVPTRKLLGWSGRDAELLSDVNPVGLVVLAHLKARETRQDLRERQRWRLDILREVWRRNLPDDEPRQLIGIVEALLDLPANLVEETMQALKNEREVPMPLETSFERYARQKGLQEGLQEGRQEGERVGEQQGLRQGILAVVEVRLGKPDEGFVALVRQAGLATLAQCLEAAKTARNLDELRLLLQAQADPA